MHCPADNSVLQLTDRHGIEIDYCPQCRGVWLDRGELDKIVERSAASISPSRSERYEGYAEPVRDWDDDDDNRRRGYYGRKRRRGWLGDLFDFD